MLICATCCSPRFCFWFASCLSALTQLFSFFFLPDCLWLLVSRVPALSSSCVKCVGFLFLSLFHQLSLWACVESSSCIQWPSVFILLGSGGFCLPAYFSSLASTLHHYCQNSPCHHFLSRQFFPSSLPLLLINCQIALYDLTITLHAPEELGPSQWSKSRQSTCCTLFMSHCFSLLRILLQR